MKCERIYLILLVIFTSMSGNVYSDCSGCAIFIEATINTKSGQKISGWVEFPGLTEQDFEMAQENNSLEIILKNNDLRSFHKDSLKIFKKIYELRHPVFWSWKPHSLWPDNIDHLKYPFIVFAAIEDTVIIQKDNIDEYTLSAKLRKLKKRPYYFQDIKVIPKAHIYKIASEEPYLVLTWEREYYTEYVYSYDNNISRDALFKRLEPLHSKYGYELNQIWDPKRNFISDKIFYFKVDHEFH